jgi:hypothetical protein
MSQGEDMKPTAKCRNKRCASRWLALGAAVMLGGALAECVTVRSGDGGFLVGGRVDIAAGNVACDEIVMLGGSVTIDGDARRDVVVLGGDLTINGIARDVVSVGGSLSRSPGAEIDGELVNVGISGFDSAPWLFDSGGWSMGRWWGLTPFHVAARTTQFVYWMLLAVLTVALVGDRVSSASRSIEHEPIRLGVIGLVRFVALTLLSYLFFVLSFLLIGIPFLIAGLLGWWPAYIFGMVAVFQLLGQKLMVVLGKTDSAQLGLVLAGGATLGVLHYFPFVGSLIWTVAAFLGLGAVFATRFGTNRPWMSSSETASPVAEAGD